MDLIRCPICGEEYSSSYDSCPFCEEDGEHTRRTRRRPRRHITTRRAAQSARGGLIAVLIVVLVLLGWNIFGGKKPAKSASKPDTQQTNATREPSAASDAADASNASDDPFYDPGLAEPATDEQPSDGQSAEQRPTEQQSAEPATDADVSGAKLNRVDFTLSNAGDTYRIKLSGTTATPHWSVDNPSVCTVSSDGTVTAVANGNTVVRCKVGTRELECVVRVRGADKTAEVSDTPQATEPVTTAPSTAANTSVEKAESINAGDMGLRTIYGTIPQNQTTKAFDVTIRPGAAMRLIVTNTGLTPESWTSSDPSVATVDGNGKVEALSVGATQINIKIGDATLACIVRVKE